MKLIKNGGRVYDPDEEQLTRKELLQKAAEKKAVERPPTTKEK